MLFPGAYQILSSAALDKKGRKHSHTLAEKASLQIKSNRLHNRMQTLSDVQKVYVPGVASLEACFASENACHAGKSMVVSLTMSIY